MYIQNLMKKNNITQYRLSIISQIPQTTLNDIINGKTKIEKCSSSTLYKLSKALEVPMETLYEKCLEEKRIQDKIIESYEYGLPEYLQHDLEAYKEGIKNNSSLLDCLWSELYSSINIAEISESVITKENANYLRDKYLWGKNEQD